MRWFANDLQSPAAVMRIDSAEIMLLGPAYAARAAFCDLLDGRLTGAPWPDSTCEAVWRQRGGRIIELGRVTRRSLAIARELGFRDPPGEAQPHYEAHAWYITGRPRFSGRIRHQCRVARGTELLPLFEPDPTDPRDPDYIRSCLEAGPSFVCEEQGQPVSWSLTNLGGAMARIFTPPQHRGKGYASSLAALQVDCMLAMQGLAVASVRVDNIGSYRIFEGLGARHIRGPLTWSRLLLPD